MPNKPKNKLSTLFYTTDSPCNGQLLKPKWYLPVSILSVIWLMYALVNKTFKSTSTAPTNELSNYLLKYGGLTANTSDLTNIYNIVTSLFLHANSLHIMSNTILFIIGWTVAQWHLKNSFICIIYFMSGIIANTCFILKAQMNQDISIVMVGASSSVYAVVAMASIYSLLMILSKVKYFKSLTFYKKIIFLLLIVSVIGMYSDLMSNINPYTNLVHAVGVIIGTASGIVAFAIQKPYKRYKIQQQNTL